MNKALKGYSTKKFYKKLNAVRTRKAFKIVQAFAILNQSVAQIEAISSARVAGTFAKAQKSIAIAETSLNAFGALATLLSTRRKPDD